MELFDEEEENENNGEDPHQSLNIIDGTNKEYDPMNLFGLGNRNDNTLTNENANAYLLTNTQRQFLLQQREPSCSTLAFHNGTEDAMFLYIERIIQKYTRTNSSLSLPDLILHAIDTFCYSRHWMMHIGDQKGLILDSVITSLIQQQQQQQQQSESVSPITCVELGTYCGYSTLRILKLLSQYAAISSSSSSSSSSPPRKPYQLYCIDNNISCINWTKRLLTLSGLYNEDYVHLIHGTCEDGIQYLIQQEQGSSRSKEGKEGEERGGVHPFIKFLFIDHDKSLYLNDLKLFEQSNLLQSPGGVICADNVLAFGRPMHEYLNHVRGKNI